MALLLEVLIILALPLSLSECAPALLRLLPLKPLFVSAHESIHVVNHILWCKQHIELIPTKQRVIATIDTHDKTHHLILRDPKIKRLAHAAELFHADDAVTIAVNADESLCKVAILLVEFLRHLESGVL